MSLIVVFLPVAFMAGIVGRFMYSFGVTMAFAIAVSLLVVVHADADDGRALSAPRRPQSRRRSTREKGLYAVIERTYMKHARLVDGPPLGDRRG